MRVLDELVDVTVTGEYVDGVTGFTTLRGQRREDVVGLEPGGFEDRDGVTARGWVTARVTARAVTLKCP